MQTDLLKNVSVVLGWCQYAQYSKHSTCESNIITKYIFFKTSVLKIKNQKYLKTKKRFKIKNNNNK